MNNIIDPSIVTSTYGKNSALGGGMSAKNDGPSFGDIMRNTAADTISTLKQSEKISAEAITGNADLNDVVQAVSAAELTLQTVMAVRDRMVNALQEVLRMPI